MAVMEGEVEVVGSSEVGEGGEAAAARVGTVGVGDLEAAAGNSWVVVEAAGSGEKAGTGMAGESPWVSEVAWAAEGQGAQDAAGAA